MLELKSSYMSECVLFALSGPHAGEMVRIHPELEGLFEIVLIILIDRLLTNYSLCPT